MDIIVDIDGTVADHSHRFHYVNCPREERDYETYYSLAPHDPPIYPVVNLVRALINDDANRVFFVTGRPERYRGETVEWLEQHFGPSTDWYGPMMRFDGDHRPNSEYKSAVLDGMRNQGLRPALAIEDQSTVVQMWRDRGLVALQAAEL